MLGKKPVEIKIILILKLNIFCSKTVKSGMSTLKGFCSVFLFFFNGLSFKRILTGVELHSLLEKYKLHWEPCFKN